MVPITSLLLALLAQLTIPGTMDTAATAAAAVALVFTNSLLEAILFYN
jgi:hypothetical protein